MGRNCFKSIYMFVPGTEGLRFKSRAGQIEYGVATAARFLRKKLCCPHAQWCNDAEMGPVTLYTLRRNTASIMKDLTDECFNSFFQVKFQSKKIERYSLQIP